MSIKCCICHHPRRAEIDKELIGGGTVAATARKFDLSYKACYNHKVSHVPRDIGHALSTRDTEQNLDLLKQMQGLMLKGQAILDRNFERGADNTALRAIDSLRGLVDAASKTAYMLHSARQVELQIKQHEAAQESLEYDQDYQDRLRVLNPRELEVLQRLQFKMEKRDPGITVLEYDHKPVKDHYQHHPKRLKRSMEKDKKASQQPTDEPVEPRNVLRPIEPEQIPGGGMRRTRYPSGSGMTVRRIT